MAMTLLNIGILAIVAAFQSGATTLKRSGMLSTATALADQQMELYRGLTYNAIGLDATSVSSALADSTYSCDTAAYVTFSADCTTGNIITSEVGPTAPATCTGVPKQCDPRQSLTGPDHHLYRVDTYIVLQYPTGSATTSRQVKLVTVVVRDRNKLSGTPLARIASTFDASTG
jgi:hypothetical protein